jgi:hypothetical protein
MVTVEDVLVFLSCTFKGLRNIPGAEAEIERLIELGWTAEEIAREIARLFPDISFRPKPKSPSPSPF